MQQFASAEVKLPPSIFIQTQTYADQSHQPATETGA